ncbi:hypothetical protein BGZ57DRAFT_932007 [Hyaloscypha finlandica]|nr:hypothetical protein BGZ57DRAFT_932007 [Hyaloscypha finlandica]
MAYARGGNCARLLQNGLQDLSAPHSQILATKKMYAFQKDEDLESLIEIIRPLRIGNILENVAQVRHEIRTLAVKGLPRTKYFSGDGPIPEEIYGMSYGPPHIRKYKLDIIDKAFKKIPGARKIDPSTLPEDEYSWSRDRIAAGVPDLVELLWVNWVPNGAHVAFSPVSPIRGADAMKLFNLGGMKSLVSAPCQDSVWDYAKCISSSRLFMTRTIQ